MITENEFREGKEIFIGQQRRVYGYAVNSLLPITNPYVFKSSDDRISSVHNISSIGFDLICEVAGVPFRTDVKYEDCHLVTEKTLR